MRTKVRILYDGCYYYVQERKVGFFTGQWKWATMTRFHQPSGVRLCPRFSKLSDAEQAAKDEFRYREGKKVVEEFYV